MAQLSLVSYYLNCSSKRKVSTEIVEGGAAIFVCDNAWRDSMQRNKGEGGAGGDGRRAESCVGFQLWLVGVDLSNNNCSEIDFRGQNQNRPELPRSPHLLHNDNELDTEHKRTRNTQHATCNTQPSHLIRLDALKITLLLLWSPPLSLHQAHQFSTLFLFRPHLYILNRVMPTQSNTSRS